MTLRAAVFATSFAALFAPFLDLGIFAQSTDIKMGLTRWLYTFLPTLSFVALVAPFSTKLRRHAVSLDVLITACALVFTMAFLLMFTLTLVAATLGLFFLMPFFWGALGTDAGENTRSLAVLPGTGGWLLLAATVLSITQTVRVWRSN